MRKIAFVSLVMASLFCAGTAHASVGCIGTVLNSYVTKSGNVIIRGSWRNDYTQICNIKSDWNGISPDVCAVWVAKIDAAISTSHTVNVYYIGSYMCDTLPTYSAAPGPEYVMLNSDPS